MRKLSGIVAIMALVALAIGAFTLPLRVESAVRRVLGGSATIQRTGRIFPLGIRLAGVSIPSGEADAPPFSIQEIRARPVPDLRARGWVGAAVEVVHPRRTVRWRADKDGLPRRLFSADLGFIASAVSSVRVRDGELTWVDETVTPAVTWKVRGGRAELRRGSAAGEYLYRAQGSLEGEPNEPVGNLNVEASLLIRGPVQAKVLLEHRRLERLGPYLLRVLGAVPSRGSLRLESTVTLHAGVLLSHNEVQLEGVVFPTEEPTVLGPSGNRLMELLTNGEGKVRFHFLVTGRLAEGLDASDLAAGAMRESLRQAMSRGIQRVLKQTERTRPVEERLRNEMDSLGR